MFKWLSLAVCAFTMLAAGPAARAAAASGGDLALERVVISTGGVAYYEYAATVDGDAKLNLTVRLDQVDDVLKSLVVFDAHGGIGSVSLPGRQPLAEIFRDLPFSEADMASLAGLLGTLKGVEVEVAGPAAVRGRILSVVEEVTVDKDGARMIHHRVSLAAPDGVHQFVLEKATGLTFTDPKLAKQVDDALAATARHRVADRRTLAISLRGQGQRTVHVGYVVAAPIWKTAYRLTVEPGKESGTLQGWAVLENQSGHDWKGVTLTLVSGNPVTFRQALYESYYVNRPEVPIDVAGHVLPPVDTGAMAAKNLAAKAASDRAARAARTAPAKSRLAMVMPEAAAPALDVPFGGGGGYAAPPPARAAEEAEAGEAATQVLFTLPRPVSVASGDSLAVPIVDATVPAVRLDLYEAGTHALNPLAAVRLTNDRPTTLPAGALTVYERGAGGAVAFVGDARIGMLPSGEDRFASFALDAKTRVDVNRHDDTRVRQATVAKGVLRVTSLLRSTTDYLIDGPAEGAVPVVIEHPRRAGWSLAAPDPKTVAETPKAYRVTATPGADGQAKLSVVLEKVVEKAESLAGMDRGRFLLLSKNGDFPPAGQAAFAKAAQLKGTLDDLERKADDLRAERRALVDDQKRIRANLEAVEAGSDLQQRYQRKLGAEEDRLEADDRDAAALKEKIVKARQALADYIAGLSF